MASKRHACCHACACRGVGRQLLKIVRQLTGSGAADKTEANTHLVPLLERLVQLRGLQQLMINLELLQLPSGMPAAWIQPGAFPQLKE